MRSASAVEQDFSHNYNNDTYTDSRIDHVFVSPKFFVDNYAMLTDCYWTAPKVDETHTRQVTLRRR